jgi:hypothetical protein
MVHKLSEKGCLIVVVRSGVFHVWLLFEMCARLLVGACGAVIAAVLWPTVCGARPKFYTL